MKAEVDGEQLALAIREVVSSRKMRASNRDKGWQSALPKLIENKLSVPEMVTVLLSLNFEVTDSGLYKWLNRNMPSEIAYLRRKKRKKKGAESSSQIEINPVGGTEADGFAEYVHTQDSLSVKERIAMGAGATLERIGSLMQDKKN